TLLWGFLPVPSASDRWQHVMPVLVGKYAEGNPVAFFRDFLQNTVIVHSAPFAQLTALGEAAVGLGLVFGCLTVLASGVGLFLVLDRKSTRLNSSHVSISCAVFCLKKKQSTAFTNRSIQADE